MRWLGFAIFAVIGVTLQTTLAWRVQIGWARPDWLLAMVVYFALRSRSEEGLIAACVLGALADLMSIERFGFLALLYGLAALTLFWVRDYFFIDHPLTHFFLTWVPAMGIGFVSAIYARLFLGVAFGSWASSSIQILLGAAYTAIWAIGIHRVMAGFPQLLGLRGPRSGGARAGELRPKHV